MLAQSELRFSNIADGAGDPEAHRSGAIKATLAVCQTRPRVVRQFGGLLGFWLETVVDQFSPWPFDRDQCSRLKIRDDLVVEPRPASLLLGGPFGFRPSFQNSAKSPFLSSFSVRRLPPKPPKPPKPAELCLSEVLEALQT